MACKLTNYVSVPFSREAIFSVKRFCTDFETNFAGYFHSCKLLAMALDHINEDHTSNIHIAHNIQRHLHPRQSMKIK